MLVIFSGWLGSGATYIDFVMIFFSFSLQKECFITIICAKQQDVFSKINEKIEQWSYSNIPVLALIRNKRYWRPLPSFSKTANSLCPQNRAKPTLWPATPSVTPCMSYLPVGLVPALLHPNPKTPSPIHSSSSWPLLAWCLPDPGVACPRGDTTVLTQKQPCSFQKHWNRDCAAPGFKTEAG